MENHRTRLVGQEPHPVDLVWLLRVGGERRGEEAASQGGEERTSVHHSIN
jgi:hypothetical protein